MSTDTPTDELWTREELEALTPFEGSFRSVDDQKIPLAREEYDAWIDMGVGQPKDLPSGIAP